MKQRALDLLSWCRTQSANPNFFFLAAAAAFGVIVITSAGLRVTRQALSPPAFTNARDLVVVSQQFPFMGMRTGVRTRDLSIWTKESKTLANTASYDWQDARVFNNTRTVRAARITPNFFEVLRVPTPKLESDTFLASGEFFHAVWNSDSKAIGRTYDINGRALRLVGVLPDGFQFLSQSPDIWIAIPPPDHPFVLARVRPGVSSQQVEDELHDIRHPFASKFEPDVASLRFLANRVRLLYGSFFAAAMILALVWSVVLYARDERRATDPKRTRRYWAMFAAKLTTLIALIALAVFEFSGVHRMGPAGERTFFSEFAAVWLSVFGTGIAAYWSLADHGERCRVCLTRMILPVRIGECGRLLFDFDGSELLCPNGHGTLYTPESALETHEPEHWYSFEETGP